MKVALATFPRAIGEVRVELDTDARTPLSLAHYVPRLGGSPVCDKRFCIPLPELEAIVRALHDGKGQLVAMRMRGEGSST